MSTNCSSQGQTYDDCLNKLEKQKRKHSYKWKNAKKLSEQFKISMAISHFCYVFFNKKLFAHHGNYIEVYTQTF